MKYATVIMAIVMILILAMPLWIKVFDLPHTVDEACSKFQFHC